MPPAPLYLRTLWRYTNAVIIIIIFLFYYYYYYYYYVLVAGENSGENVLGKCPTYNPETFSPGY